MSKSIYQKYLDVNRSYIYILLVIACAIPIMKPIAIPMVISQEVQTFRQQIETVEPGDTVLMLLSIDRADELEMGLPMYSIFKEYVEEGVKVILFTMRDPTIMLLLPHIEEVQAIPGITYGEDWMFYGYVPPTEAGIAALAADMFSVPTDFYGNPTSELPILQNIKEPTDIKLIVSATVGGSGSADMWVRQWVAPFGVPLVVSTFRGGYPALLPYVESGQIAGILGGGLAPAEYEILTKHPGRAVASIGSQTLVHLTMIILGFMHMISVLMVRNERRVEK